MTVREANTSEAATVVGTPKSRTIDVPLETLPPIDEHSIEVDAPAEATWAALFPTLEASFDGRYARRYAERIEAKMTGAAGDLHHPGGTLPGFTVTRAIAPVMLALAGEHKFAKYAVVFRIDLLPGQRSCVRLETRAQFLGKKGRLYKAGVIGTRGHVIVVNRMLRTIKRRAERSGS
jgi:hypothetical protein